MLTVQLYDDDDGQYSAGLVDSDTWRILAVVPKHWPINDRLEKLRTGKVACGSNA